MIYVEWLRIRNLLRIVAIILGILVVLALVLRISFSRYTSPEAWIAHLSADHATKEVHQTLPDGTKRLIIDDPADRTRIVVDDHGYGGRHIVVTEPSSQVHGSPDIAIGKVQSFKSPDGKTTTTVIDTNGMVPMLFYMGLADVVALIVATILAAPFAREIDGHLELTLTKPISRLRYAFGAIGVDVVGIVSASVITVLAVYLCQLFFGSTKVDFSGVNARAVGMGIAFPLAWYALLCAATTWVGRSFGAVLGFAWPVALFVGLLTLIPPANLVALFVHDVAWVISRLDPLTYVSIANPSSSQTYASQSSDYGLRMSLQVLFFVAYSAIAIFKWWRVEA